MKLYFDSLTTLKVIHAESPVVIFFGTYGISDQSRVALLFFFTLVYWYKHKNDTHCNFRKSVVKSVNPLKKRTHFEFENNEHFYNVQNI